MNCLQMLFSQHTAWNIQQGALDGTAVKMEQKSRKEKITLIKADTLVAMLFVQIKNHIFIS